MSAIYAVINSLITSLQGIVFKSYNKKVVPKGNTNDFLFYSVDFIVYFIILLVINLFMTIDIKSCIYGAVGGCIFCVMRLSYATCLKRNNILFANFMCIFGSFIPIIYSAVFLNEGIRTMEIVGFFILFFSAFILCFGDKIYLRIKHKVESAEKQKLSKKERALKVIPLIMAVILSGVMNTYIKGTGTVYKEMNLWSFLLASSFVSTLFIVISYFITTKSPLNIKQHIPNKLFVILAFIAGVGMVLSNVTGNYFSVRSIGSIYYPITYTMPIIIAVIVSPLFKEKTSIISLIGVGIGIVGVVLMNI